MQTICTKKYTAKGIILRQKTIETQRFQWYHLQITIITKEN